MLVSAKFGFIFSVPCGDPILWPVHWRACYKYVTMSGLLSLDVLMTLFPHLRQP